MHFRNLQEYLAYFNSPTVEPKRYEEPKVKPEKEEAEKEEAEQKKRGKKA